MVPKFDCIVVSNLYEMLPIVLHALLEVQFCVEGKMWINSFSSTNFMVESVHGASSNFIN